MLTSMAALDVNMVTVRGPITGSRQGVVTNARLFVHEGRLYLAESPDKGWTIRRVTSYDLPEGAPSRPGRAATWAGWRWSSSCGCANRWSRWTPAQLAAMAVTDTEG